MKKWQKIGLAVVIAGIGFAIGYEAIPVFKLKIDELKSKIKKKK